MKVFAILLVSMLGMAHRGCAQSVKKDVCIVGGGASGIYSAKLLEEKGYDVTVLEKESRVGGLTVPYFNDDGTPILRHLLTADMDIVLALQAEYGMFSESLGSAFNPDRYVYFHNCGDACIPIPLDQLPPPSSELQAAAFKYIGIVTQMEGLLKQSGHVGTAEQYPELLVPFGQWLAQNDLLPLAPIFYTYVTAYGNGFFDYTPAIYILKIIPATTMHQILSVGLDIMAPHEIVEKMARNLSDVRVNSEVVSLTGTDGNHVLKTVNQDETFLCDKVMLAFGDSTKGFEFIKNLKQDTQAVFDRLDVLYYHEAITTDVKYTDDVPERFTFSALPAPTGEKIDDVPGVHVHYAVTEGSSYTMSLLNSGLKNTPAEDVIDATLANLNELLPAFGRNALSSPLTADDVVQLTQHEYKPHVNTAEFQAGFYDDLDAVQGNDGIYVVGSILDYEIVNAALRSAQTVVEKYFPEKD